VFGYDIHIPFLIIMARLENKKVCKYLEKNGSCTSYRKFWYFDSSSYLTMNFKLKKLTFESSTIQNMQMHITPRGSSLLKRRRMFDMERVIYININIYIYIYK